MELASAVTMDRTDAAIKGIEAREAWRATEDERYRQIAEGYEALAEGVALIDLPQAIRQAGLDDDGRPRMAATRADARVCFVLTYSERVEFRADSAWAQRRADVFEVPDFPGAKWVGNEGIGAIVPIVPPEHRPLGRGGRYKDRMISLRPFTILWEVEEGGWQPRRSLRAPRDPALLRHVGGNLYSVIAVWDLTDLERRVLEGQRT